MNDILRQIGDYGIVKTEFGYHLMYFVSSRPVWQEAVKNEMANTIANDLMNEILGKYTMEADFENILLANVNLAGDTNAANGVVETPVQANKKANLPVIMIAGVSLAALAAAAFVFDKKEHE